MAIAGMKWLGTKLGVDITGSEEKPRGDGWVDRLGQTFFEANPEDAKEDDNIPTNDTEYVYNKENERWEPHPNASAAIWADFEDKLRNPTKPSGEPLNQGAVAPPPPPPPRGACSPTFSSPTNNYVDCFSGAGTPANQQAPPPAGAFPAQPPTPVHESAPQVTLKATQVRVVLRCVVCLLFLLDLL